MNLTKAIERLSNGGRVRRPAWVCHAGELEIELGKSTTIMYRESRGDGCFSKPWLPTTADIMATDWEAIDTT